MGCFQSRPSEDYAPDTTSGEPVLNAAPIPLSDTQTQNYNIQDFKNHKWTSKTPIAEEQIHKQRTEFWETASTYGGRPESWKALQELCACTDILEARKIAKSASLHFPTGKVWEGCYDSLGNFYTIPTYCLSLPTNVTKGSQKVEVVPSNQANELEATNFNLKIRLNTTSEDVGLEVSMNDTVKQMTDRLLKKQQFLDGRSYKFRFILLGKILTEGTKLSSLKLSSESVLQAQVTSF